MSETVLVSEVIFATRERLYAAWLDSKEHSAFTAKVAEIEPAVGGSHSSFSGYATGQVLALEPHRRIIQSWRTTEFPAGAPDSRLEVTFEDTLGGTLITILHTGIPEGQSDRYRDGWLRHYFAPMKDYFARESAPDTIPDFLIPDALAPAPARRPPTGRARVKGKAKPKAKAGAKARAKARPARVKAKPGRAAAAKKTARPKRKPAPRKTRPSRKKAAKPAARGARKKPRARS
jgi:uncharacterized protein YndB with AHSA1/START domain